MGLPSGTVTFLFTDMEGSTRRWEEDPDGMRVAVADHDEVVRVAIEANGGYVFANGGDGFAAAFSRAADAVAAVQTALAEIDGIAVRMGINTGEVHERDGDYFGPAVNRTARLMAAGHGGQVLISGVTAELVPGLVLRNQEGALAASILGALGVPERQGEAVLDTLCAWAGSRQALVVIDNCEHLLSEASEVVDRMRHCRSTSEQLRPGLWPSPSQMTIDGGPAVRPAKSS